MKKIVFINEKLTLTNQAYEYLLCGPSTPRTEQEKFMVVPGRYVPWKLRMNENRTRKILLYHLYPEIASVFPKTINFKTLKALSLHWFLIVHGDATLKLAKTLLS